MPAVLKPAKEKHLNHTKAQERDETPRKKMTSPTKPRKSRSSPVATAQPAEEFFPQGDVTVEATVSLNVDVKQSMNSSPEEQVVVNPSQDDRIMSQVNLNKNVEEEHVVGQGHVGDEQFQGRGYEAFYINPDVSVEVSLPALAQQTDGEVTSSYTVVDHVHTVESARAAGIPVVTKSSEKSPIRRTTSRDDSMTSSRSSGDFSDHESHKIHYDHKTRETTVAAKISPREVLSPPIDPRKPMLVVSEIPKILDPAGDRAKTITTNFAEIKRIKDTYGNVDGSGMVYMQHGQDPQGNERAPLKSAFLRKQADSGKKTSFAMLPNETTWQMTARQASLDAAKEAQQDSEQPVCLELTSLRMKLDEKRKEIERRKQRVEVQQNKMRQRLGKAAFMRVVSRHMDDQPGSADMDDRLDQSPVDSGQGLIHRPRSLSESPTGHKSRPFSREGIQETIDNVRKRWFKDDDLLGGVTRPVEERDNETHAQPPAFVGKDPAAARPQVDALPTAALPLTSAGAHPQPMTDSTGSLPSSENGATFEVYDSSLDKLNQSLSELQGEISRLSLQQEQILNMQSPQGAPPVDPRIHPVAKQQPPLAGYPVPHQIALPCDVQMGQGEPYKSIEGAADLNTSKHLPRIPVNRLSPEMSRQTLPTSQTLPYIVPLQSAGISASAPSSSPALQRSRLADASSVSVPSANQQQTQFSDTYCVNNVPPVTHQQQQNRFADTYSVNPVPSAKHQQQTRFADTSNGSMPSADQNQTPFTDTYSVSNQITRPGAMPSSGDYNHSNSQTEVCSDNGAGDDSTSSHTSSGGPEGFFVSFGDDSGTPKRSKPILSKDRVKKTHAVVAQVNVANTVTPAPESRSPVVNASPLEVQGTPTIQVYQSPRAGSDDSQNSSGIGYLLDDSDLGLSKKVSLFQFFF